MTNIAIVFPGQGSQRPGMVADFYSSFPQVRALFRTASEVLALDMEKICFNEIDCLNRTEITQPAIVTAEICIYRVMQEQLFINDAIFGGHSLGEYAALVAAGVISFEDTLRIVRKRGQLMQAAVSEGAGAMVALLHDNISLDYVRTLLDKEEVEIANINSPSQIVLSGLKSDIESACLKLRGAMPSLIVVELNVSAPFHSRLMKGVEKEFGKYLRSFSPHFNLGASSKVASNYTGTFHQENTCIDSLIKQISGCVDWVSNMRQLTQKTANIVEIGPARVLGKFFAGIGVSVPSIVDLRSMNRYVLLGGDENDFCPA